MGKWHGLVFATPHPTTLGLTRAVGKAPRDDAFAVATGDSDGLGQVSAALSFVADCVLVDCDSSSPLCRSQLAGLQRLRQAFLAVVPAPTCEADLRASVGNVADLVDGMVVRCPAEFPDGDARSYYDDLNRECPCIGPWESHSNTGISSDWLYTLVFVEFSPIQQSLC